MRALRSLGLVVVGFYAGLVAAAALVKRALPSHGDAESDDVRLAAILGGVELQSRAQAFRGGSMLAWFGGIAVDLREAKLAADARLTVTAIFGGVDVKVPAGWRVESRARSLAGGVSVDVLAPEDPTAPTLTIDGGTVFGGVSIRAVAGTPAA
jgi:hypothetical protein